MSLIPVDLTDVNPEDELVAPGWYRVRIKEAKPQTKRDDASVQGINVWLEIEDGGGEFDGRLLFNNLWFHTSGARRMSRRFLDAAGYEITPDGIDTMLLMGLELEVQVEHGEWRGEPREEVRNFRSL